MTGIICPRRRSRGDVWYRDLPVAKYTYLTDMELYMIISEVKREIENQQDVYKKEEQSEIEQKETLNQEGEHNVPGEI